MTRLANGLWILGVLLLAVAIPFYPGYDAGRLALGGILSLVVGTVIFVSYEEETED